MFYEILVIKKYMSDPDSPDVHYFVSLLLDDKKSNNAFLSCLIYSYNHARP